MHVRRVVESSLSTSPNCRMGNNPSCEFKCRRRAGNLDFAVVTLKLDYTKYRKWAPLLCPFRLILHLHSTKIFPG